MNREELREKLKDCPNIPWPEDYDVSFHFAFVYPNPKSELPVYFKPWTYLAHNLHRHLERHTVRQAVHKMTELDHTKLKDPSDQMCAYVCLTYITSGYVWQEKDRDLVTTLPRQLAVPLCGVSEMLKMKPINTYTSSILANWKLKQPDGPIEISNLATIAALHPEESSSWFCRVILSIEIKFAEAIQPLLEALYAVWRKHTSDLCGSLDKMTKTIIEMKNILSRIHEHLEPMAFFKDIRRLYNGWSSGSLLPDGLVYEGVSTRPQQYVGAGNTQSSTFQALDVVLGIQHDKERQDFILKMREYMPPKHRDFVNALQSAPSIKQYVQKSNNEQLKNSYNSLLSVLEGFRSYHIQLVAKFIFQQRSKLSKDERAGEAGIRGTVGTESIMPFLKNVRDDVKHGQVH